MVLDKISKFFKSSKEEEYDSYSESEELPPEDYVEIKPVSNEFGNNKLSVKYFVLTDFEDLKGIVDAIRDGYTIAFVKIRPLKEKNINELRRTIDKIKKTCFAMDGEVVGLEEDWIVAVPPYIKVYRGGPNV